ncbi:MAG: iron-sulfur cluster assembly protein, partial [Microbacterium sp.]
MSADLTARVTDAVGRVVDPELRRPIGELGMVGAVEAAGGAVRVEVRLTVVGCPAADRIEHDVREAAARVAGVEAVEVAL